MLLREKITKAALHRGLSLPELAVRAGIAYHTLLGYSGPRSTRIPNGKTALAIAKALDTTVDWLLDDDCSMPPPSRSESVPLQDVANDRLANEFNHRRAVWLLRHFPLIEDLDRVKWAAVDAWCREHDQSVDPPAEIRAAFAHEVLVTRLQNEFAIWYEPTDAFYSLASTQKAIARWLSLPRAPDRVRSRAFTTVGQLPIQELERLKSAASPPPEGKPAKRRLARE